MSIQERRRRAGEKSVVCAELLNVLPEHALDGVVLTYGLIARWLREIDVTWPLVDRRVLVRRLRDRVDLRAVVDRHALIVRSAHSCEDLPGHSAAGLFLSRGGVKTKEEVGRAVVDVIAAALTVPTADVPWPSVLVQPEQRARISGVAVSRGVDGAYGAYGYQAVRGAGGGVRGGDVEEGFVSPIAHAIMRGAGRRILDAELGRALGALVMRIERLFFDVIEPQRGYAVDVEWLHARRGLIIVQARAA